MGSEQINSQTTKSEIFAKIQRASLLARDERIAAWEKVIAENMSCTKIPDGWKLVPIEPTFPMLQEYAAVEHDINGVFVTEDLKKAYRTMLAAAPEPPMEAL